MNATTETQCARRDDMKKRCILTAADLRARCKVGDTRRGVAA